MAINPNRAGKAGSTMTLTLSTLPGPKGYPLLGHLPQFAKDPLAFLTFCSQHYGDLVPLHWINKPACFLNHPRYVETLFKDPDTFVKSRAYLAMQTLLGRGLLTREGKSWFQQRRLVQPVFYQGRISSYADTMVSLTQQLLESWKPGEQRNIHRDMMQLTLDIVMSSIFSENLSAEDAKTVSDSMEIALQWFEGKRRTGFFWLNFPGPVARRYQQQVAQMDTIIHRIIQTRRHSMQSHDPGDLLSLLMQVRDEDDGSQMSDQQLRDEIATLMLAGHETTANALTWTWLLLAQNPTQRDRLNQELATVLGTKPPTFADLSQLVYTSQVIKESLRLYPPAGLLGRIVTKETVLGNCRLPKGCIVIASQWVMHRNPVYFDEPEQFRPERWQTDLEKQLPKGVYTPFGDGPRVCIGKNFAMLEAVLVLATVAQRFRLDLVPGQTIIPKQSITLRPSPGVWMQVND